MSRQFRAAIWTTVAFLLIITGHLLPDPSPQSGESSVSLIRRLTHSGEGHVRFPSLSKDGGRMAYVFENEDSSGQVSKSIRILNLQTGEETELFKSSQRKAPPPFEDIDLLVGSKPPLLSGDGSRVVFTMSLAAPNRLIDHYLAVVPSDGGEIRITAFPLSSLAELDLEDLEFDSPDWERVANFAVSSDGTRVACLVKGFLGPNRYGTASGIILWDVPDNRQRTLLAPRFSGQQWIWPEFPSSPGTGGGWGFALSGDGDRLIFGARNSDLETDFDLYSTDWADLKPTRITEIRDRWINLVDTDETGGRIAFFYGGRKLEGLGTYLMTEGQPNIRHVSSSLTVRVDFVDLSGDGNRLLYKDLYTGVSLNILTGRESVIFESNTPGYARGPFPMDFPAYPAFWQPRLVDESGKRVLLAGPVEGKNQPEVFLLETSRR